MIITVQYVNFKFYKGFAYYVEPLHEKELKIHKAYKNALEEYINRGGTLPPKIEQGIKK